MADVPVNFQSIVYNLNTKGTSLLDTKDCNSYLLWEILRNVSQTNLSSNGSNFMSVQPLRQQPL